MKVFNAAGRLYRRLKNIYELNKYTPETICEYFRKQGARIGEGCYIIPTELSTEPYLITIGNHVAIAYGVSFMTHDGGAWIFREEFPDIQVFGPVVIEDNCLIGQDSILFPNIRIGRNSIIGANSVVISDIPPNTIAMGVPARPFGSVEKYREKCLERWAAQKPPGGIEPLPENWWGPVRREKNRQVLRRHLLELFKEELKIHDES